MTHVVNVSSTAGRMAAMGSAVYNMTKWGVTGFSEALRQEGLHIGVRVTCVEPGFVEPELQGHNSNPMILEQIEKMREQVGDVLQADDIARPSSTRSRSRSTSRSTRSWSGPPASRAEARLLHARRRAPLQDPHQAPG